MRITVLFMLSAAAILAQPRAGTPLYPGGAPGPKSPVQSGVHPGTPIQVNRPTRPGGSGTVGSGLAGVGRGQQGGRQYRRPGAPIIVPFYAPFYGSPYYGGYGGNGYQDEYGGQPPIAPPPSQQGVYLNRDYQPERINPVVRDYSNAPLPEAVPQETNPVRIFDAPVHLGSNRDPEPTIYLIALKDQTVIPALAYWPEGDTLRYVTRQHAVNLISLDLVDRPFSIKLNRERSVDFNLP